MTTDIDRCYNNDNQSFETHTDRPVNCQAREWSRNEVQSAGRVHTGLWTPSACFDGRNSEFGRGTVRVFLRPFLEEDMKNPADPKARSEHNMAL